jgi:hypothetical protein
LWHQPKGIADEEAEEGRHAEPFVLDTDPHAELNWDEQEFYIKWKGQSYLHCQWQLLSDLSQLSGYKKVLNYMKKIEDDRQIRQTLSAEEVISFLSQSCHPHWDFLMSLVKSYMSCLFVSALGTWHSQGIFFSSFPPFLLSVS